MPARSPAGFEALDVYGDLDFAEHEVVVGGIPRTAHVPRAINSGFLGVAWDDPEESLLCAQITPSAAGSTSRRCSRSPTACAASTSRTVSVSACARLESYSSAWSPRRVIVQANRRAAIAVPEPRRLRGSRRPPRLPTLRARPRPEQDLRRRAGQRPPRRACREASRESSRARVVPLDRARAPACEGARRARVVEPVDVVIHWIESISLCG